MRRKFELHRLLMRLSYAMTFAAVTLRLQIPIGLMLGYTSYSAMSVWLAYTSWIPNVVVVLVYSALERSRKRASSRRPMAAATHRLSDCGAPGSTVERQTAPRRRE